MQFYCFSMVKQRVVGKDPINEDEFEAIVEGHSKGVNDDLSSISGLDDESDDPEHQPPSQAQVLPRSNRIYFIHPSVEGVLSIWRLVVLTEKEYLQGEKGSTDLEDTEKLCIREAELATRLQALISSGSESDKNSSRQPHTWVVLLAAGGHFAGIVVNTKDGEVLAHHTFHRFVVRAKARGRQSTQDKFGKAPKSAGSSLRRYNEAALQKEIRELLSSWSFYIQFASHMFVHTPSANRQALFGGENAPLSRNDPRIWHIPFTTRRPTYKEAKRVHYILASISYVDEIHSNEMEHEILNNRKEGATKNPKVGGPLSVKSKEATHVKGLHHSRDPADGGRPSLANVSELSSTAESDGNGPQKMVSPLHQIWKLQTSA